MKTYDEKYFARWYADRRTRIVTPQERARRIQMAVTVSEFVLGRRLRSVLDVGCGEGRWQPVLARLRPRASYIGVDSSDYAVRRYGRRRGIIKGRFAELDTIVPGHSFDLVVASDVIHYLSRSELETALPQLVHRVGGVAYLDVFTSGDGIEGDMREMRLRSPRYYRSLFSRMGLRALGLQFYARTERAGTLSALEACAEVR